MTLLCKDCEDLHDKIWCKSPLNGISLVTGEPNVVFASINRDFVNSRTGDPHGCGADARWFRPKYVPPTPVPTRHSLWELLKYHFGVNSKVD